MEGVVCTTEYLQPKNNNLYVRHTLLKYFKRVILLIQILHYQIFQTSYTSHPNPTLSNTPHPKIMNGTISLVVINFQKLTIIEIFIHICSVKEIFIFLTPKKEEIFIFEILFLIKRYFFKFVCGVRFKIYMNVKLDPKKMGLFSLFSFYLYSQDHLNFK